MVQIRRPQGEDATVAMQIRAGRALLGWTQDEVAAKTGVSRRTIVDAETGVRRPHVATLERITAVFAEAGVAWVASGEHVGAVRLVPGRADARELEPSLTLAR